MPNHAEHIREVSYTFYMANSNNE